MGYMRHHAIIVTGFQKEEIFAAYTEASMMALHPCSPIGPCVNGYHSFFIPPDGSKEGWEDSLEGDRKRDEFVALLKAKKEEGKWFFTWAEVQYGDDNGDDNGDDKVVRTEATDG